MSTEEQLLEFLYLAPVALIKFDDAGNVQMANPRVAQLFNRYAPGGYFANFFDFLSDVLPDLKLAITSFESDNGQIMENERFQITAPALFGDEELWLDVTIMRQAEDLYIASLNNVTNQVKAENAKYITEQKMSKVLESVSKHVIFTLSAEGVVDSWNLTGETYIASANAAKGKLLSQIVNISVPKNAEYLKEAIDKGVVKDELRINTLSSKGVLAHLCISSITDSKNTHCGYSVVITLGDENH